MLVKQFNLRRNDDRGGFQSTAQSEIERPGFYRGFTAVGKTLTDVKEFERRRRKAEMWSNLTVTSARVFKSFTEMNNGARGGEPWRLCDLVDIYPRGLRGGVAC